MYLSTRLYANVCNHAQQSQSLICFMSYSIIIIMYYDHIDLFSSENNEDSRGTRLQYHLFFIPTRSLVCENRLEVSYKYYKVKLYIIAVQCKWSYFKSF